ncbi:50S ribosomal protein L6 [Candidatus Woesearchaeota archaeon CG10_big_fil_rev_8_21_14_0_10_32_24]|nr:MAG: 50S ribosomal protein L6 [Candidatus Woesearchaeota archaeon CG10_big_fil_rev_8_21_14_0_10_32_24]
MKQDLQLEVELTNGVTANLEGTVLKVKGPKGEVERDFAHPRIKVTIEGNHIILKAAKATKREKTILGSYTAHMKNMAKGVLEPFKYKVKICSGHFPMNVTMSGQELIVKNFLGEAVPRRVMLPQGTSVKVNGIEIDISSPNKELAGQAASKIENLCRITNRDRRIFQDGLYITEKAK